MPAQMICPYTILRSNVGESADLIGQQKNPYDNRTHLTLNAAFAHYDFARLGFVIMTDKYVASHLRKDLFTCSLQLLQVF